jgi:hypothetical protein
MEHDGLLPCPGAPVEGDGMADMHGMLDLSDPDVYSMADYDHRPAEVWSNDGHLMWVVCEQCNNSWPCATKQELRKLGPP